MPELSIPEAFQFALKHHQTGRLDLAEPIYRRIVQINPQHSDAIHLLGMVAFQRGQAELAAEYVKRAIALRPGVAIYHNNLGQTLERLGDRQAAAREYRTALTLAPDYPEAHNNLANILERENRFADAIAGYRTAISLNPDYAEAYANLGNVFKEQGDLDQAIACYRQAVARGPNLSLLHSNLLLALHYHGGYSPADLAREHRAWAERHAAPLRQEARPHANDCAPERRLRVGYVSGDFCEHVVGWNILPLFMHRDRREFEVYAYSQNSKRDQVAERLRGLCDRWRPIAGQSDRDVAEAIRHDGIDILVDLSLHSAGTRLLVFARKPAPVQVTFAGYPATTGLEAIDYRLTDPFLDPPGAHDEHYVEESFRLPHSFWCYTPHMPTPEPGPPPHLNTGRVTFGCMNNFCKISDVTLGLWAQILNALPGAMIKVLCRVGSDRGDWLEKFARCGGNTSQIEFVDRVPRDQYLRYYEHLDIILDTYPYTGHTTSCDALWMGVPVVTLAGETAVSRGGYSLLSNLGLPELATTRQDEYIRIAVELALDQARLAELRQSLRPRMKASPLMDGPGWTRGIEEAFRTMWRHWCKRSPA